MFKIEHSLTARLGERTSMTSRQDQRQEDTYFRVMRLLQENPQMTQRELARSLDISLGGANYCMNALITKGWVKIQNFRNSQDKLSYAYLLTPIGITKKAALAANFLKRKMHEFRGLQAEIKSLQLDLDRLPPASRDAANPTAHPDD